MITFKYETLLIRFAIIYKPHWGDNYLVVDDMMGLLDEVVWLFLLELAQWVRTEESYVTWWTSRRFIRYLKPIGHFILKYWNWMLIWITNFGAKWKNNFTNLSNMQIMINLKAVSKRARKLMLAKKEHRSKSRSAQLIISAISVSLPEFLFYLYPHHIMFGLLVRYLWTSDLFSWLSHRWWNFNNYFNNNPVMRLK